MTRWRPKFALLPLVMATFLGIFALGCDRQEAGGDKKAGGTEAPAGDTIRVGQYGSMTGSTATFGQSTDQGVKLAVEEINAAGGINGKKIELFTEDTRGQSQEAGTVVTKLITDRKVVAVLGEVASSLSIAGGRVAQQYGVPMISPSSTNPDVTKIGDKISRVCFIDPFQGYVGAKFVKENLKLHKVAVLFDQSQAYSKGLKDDFLKAAKKMGLEVTSEQAYNEGDQDFSAQLTSIRESAPDAIYVPGYYTEVGNIAVQARKLGITAPLVGGDGWESDKLAEIGGKAIDGCYYSSHYSHEDPRPELQEFLKKFQAKYNAVPDSMAVLGYDAAALLFDAMKRSPSLKGDDLAKTIAETKGYKGVSGTITMDADRNAQKPAVVLQMKDGKPVFVTNISPE